MASRLPFFLSIGGAVVGAILIILAGILGWVVVPNIIDNRVEKETRLEPGNDIYEKWENLPIPIYTYFYFFNVTNIEDFEDFEGGQPNLSGTPFFEEVGPFVFREVRNKTEIQDGPFDTVYFKENIVYIFDEEKSGKDKHGNQLTATSTVNIVNVPFVTVMTLMDINQEFRFLARTVLDSLLQSGEGTFIRNVPVAEVLYTGFNIEAARDGGKSKQMYGIVEGVARSQGLPLPEEIMNGDYALFRARNNTNDGYAQVFRGREDSSRFATYRMINGTDDLMGKFNLENWWKDECAMINGTDGTMFPPFVDEDRKLELYVPEVCRSIYLRYSNKTEYEDIKGLRFTFPPELFAKPEDHPPNGCFCEPYRAPLKGGCDYTGVWKIHTCKASVPIIVSKPHFLDADESLTNRGRAMGLSPIRDRHDSYIDVEPYTGFPLRVHVRLQVGLEVQRYYSMEHPVLNKIPHEYYPIFWLDKGAELDEPLVEEIKDKLVKPLNIVNIVRWTLIGVGAFLVVGGVIWLVVIKMR